MLKKKRRGSVRKFEKMSHENEESIKKNARGKIPLDALWENIKR